jgi:hypothetical protein
MRSNDGPMRGEGLMRQKYARDCCEFDLKWANERKGLNETEICRKKIKK